LLLAHTVQGSELFVTLSCELDKEDKFEERGEAKMKNHKILSRRDFLRTLGASAAGISLAACATPAGPVPAAAPGQPAAASEFTFWFPWQSQGEFLMKAFNDAELGVSSKWELGEYDSSTKIIAAIAAGNPPPLAYLGRWQTTDLAVRNALVVLDDPISTAKTFKWENIWERLQKDSISWGKKWVIPYTTDTRALFYNKQLMRDADLDPEKPPLTWDETREMAIKLTKQDAAGRLDQIGFTPSFGNPPVYLMFLTMIWCLGSDMVNEDMSQITITDKGEEAMTFLKQLMDDQGGYEAAVAFTQGLSLAEGIDAFSAGKVGLAMNGQWVLNSYDQYAPDLEYGMIPGPVFPEYDIHANYDGGGGWFFFKQGGNFNEAWQFVEHVMEPQTFLAYAEEFEALPARSDVGAEWAKKDARREVFVATANTVRWIPIFAGVLETLSFLATMFDNVLIGGNDMATELADAQAKMQALLDKHNAYPVPS
jgi:multiple sugar transport system substrate-binding protein